MTDETISEKCETLYNKLNSFVTSVINRDVTPQINNLQTGKANIVHYHDSDRVLERNALSNIGTRVNALQSEVNGAVDNKIGSLSNSITNITGFSLVYDGYDHRIKVYANGILAYFIMQGTFVVNSSGTTSTGSIPSQYAPQEQTTIRAHPSGTDGILLGSDGSITYYATSGTTTSRIVRITYCYPVKASLP